MKAIAYIATSLDGYIAESMSMAGASFKAAWPPAASPTW